MPSTPEPKGASPDLMPFLRWTRQTLLEMIAQQARQQNTDYNTNSSQNSTMSALVDRLGTVETMMETITSDLTITASQVTSGVFDIDRIPVLDSGRVPGLDASKIVSGTLGVPVSTGGDVTAAGHGTFNSAWGYNVSGVTRLAVWMDSSGRLGQTSSSERFKTNIEEYIPNETAVRLLRLVSFNWKADYTEHTHHKEVGLIAEQLHNLGLRWLVAYEADGKTPLGIHYDRLALVLLPLVQRLADEADDTKARLEDMEMRLAALEGSN